MSHEHLPVLFSPGSLYAIRLLTSLLTAGLIMRW